MNLPQDLTPRQRQMIQSLLATIDSDFSMTITHQLEQQMHANGVRNPVAFVRYSVLAVRQGRFGPNRGLHIPRAKLAATGTDRQHVGEDHTHG